MMAVYSAFFSSGLLAPRATTPAPPSSPMPIPSSPMDPVDRAFSVTPTPNATSTSIAAVPTANLDCPPTRRRRSSISIAASSMAFIKSPTRNAGFALQRTGVMSPSRSRAGSIAEGASESNSLLGRLRSGTLNTGAPMRLRRTIKRTVPLAPPPTVPLPALPPPSPSAKFSNIVTPPPIIVPSPHQPLMNYFADSKAPSLHNPASAIQVTPEMSISSSPPPTCYFGQTIDEDMKEN